LSNPSQRGALGRVPAAALPALVRCLARARHDLGKYVAFQARWLGESPDTDELRAALLADLARTRSAGEAVESAPAVWARLRPALTGSAPLDDGTTADLRGDPDLEQVERGMSAIERALPGLARATHHELTAARAAALDAADALHRLHARARQVAGA
jgi:hypothetical protein